MLLQTVTKTMPETNIHRGDEEFGGLQNHGYYHNVSQLVRFSHNCDQLAILLQSTFEFWKAIDVIVQNGSKNQIVIHLLYCELQYLCPVNAQVLNVYVPFSSCRCMETFKQKQQWTACYLPTHRRGHLC